MKPGEHNLEAKNQIETKYKIAHITGARPNIIKMAPVYKAIEADTKIEQVVFHTGQQSDKQMVDAFYREFNIGRYDIQLLEAPGMTISRARRLASMVDHLQTNLTEMDYYELPFSAIVVYGDTDSTLAGALAGAMAGIRVIHVEAGLRCWDRSLPEELNRILTDQIADIQLCYCHISFSNLIKENTRHGTPILVGNVLADALQMIKAKVEAMPAPDYGKAGYILATFHRPANVDNPLKLKAILDALETLANKSSRPIVLPMHPRAADKYYAAGYGADSNKIIINSPMTYAAFIKHLAHAHCVITDSGGVQEEATMLGVRCLTFRPNTERPITVINGTNTVIGDNPAGILPAFASMRPVGPVISPPYWDAGAAKRIAIIIEGFLKRNAKNA